MNCLWLIILLALCGGNSCGCERNGGNNNSCGCGRRGDDRRNDDRRGRDSDCGCGRREREDDCGCDDGQRRRGMTSMPPFGRSQDSDTCGCDIQEECWSSPDTKAICAPCFPYSGTGAHFFRIFMADEKNTLTRGNFNVIILLSKEKWSVGRIWTEKNM